MLLRAKLFLGTCALAFIACGDDDDHPDKARKADASTGSAENAAETSGRSGNAGNGGEAASAGRAGRRSPTSCTPQPAEEVTCGGEVCPTSTKHEHDPCFRPCCVTFEGAERCGFRGTSAAFTTECVLPAVSDPSCDEVPQFEGCCEPTKKVCGVIGGFEPGCQTESRFLTFPDPLKKCGAGTADADGGT